MQRRTRSSTSTRAILIRVLLVGAFALLIAGSLAPLLTTTRFYFFANTFSLTSGIGELVANGQWLLACLIVLFSFCVPVIKMAVIWVGTTGQLESRPLHVMTDRFGKWSMLEVFVAALLITALKLGPVVDATLHYGAYLLAASVVISGVASQLISHRRVDPLLSSPATLTVGAIGGAVMATTLIGFLNPRALDFGAIIGTREARCIERVLLAEHLAVERAGARTDYVASLRALDAEACPQTFAKAFTGYIDAWSKLASLDAQGTSERSVLWRAGARLGLVATRDDRLEAIAEAWNEVVVAAREYGVNAPAR